MVPLYLLHGALGSGRQLDPLTAELTESFNVHSLDFSGHGGLPIPERFRTEDFAREVLQAWDEKGIARADIFGYSMGGYVGLYLASNYPDRIGRVFTLGTKLAWDEESTAREVAMLDPAKIMDKLPKFVEILQRRHHPKSWEDIVLLSAEMMQHMAGNPPLKESDFSNIDCPVMLAIGDSDMTAGVEDTVATFRMLSQARLLVLPNTPHPFEQVSLANLAREIRMFFRR